MNEYVTLVPTNNFSGLVFKKLLKHLSESPGKKNSIALYGKIMNKSRTLLPTKIFLDYNAKLLKDALIVMMH